MCVCDACASLCVVLAHFWLCVCVLLAHCRVGVLLISGCVCCLLIAVCVLIADFPVSVLLISGYVCVCCEFLNVCPTLETTESGQPGLHQASVSPGEGGLGEDGQGVGPRISFDFPALGHTSWSVLVEPRRLLRDIDRP